MNEVYILTSFPIRSLHIFLSRATLTSSLEAASFSSSSIVKPYFAPIIHMYGNLLTKTQINHNSRDGRITNTKANRPKNSQGILQKSSFCR